MVRFSGWFPMYFPEGLSGSGKAGYVTRNEFTYVMASKRAGALSASDHFICCWIVLGVVLLAASLYRP